MAHHKALSSSHYFGEKVEKRKDERPQDQDGAATGWDGLGHPTDAQAITTRMTQDVTVRVGSISSAMIDQAKDEAETN
jgi:hypothetical protein